MFERFTDRSRKAMAIANQEAQRFNHEYIGDEHMLLGMVKDDGCVAVLILRNLKIDPRKVRLEVEKLLKPGPELVTLGALPKTPNAKYAVELAIEASRTLGTNYVGTEHLLIGVALVEGGIGSAALVNCGTSADLIREEVKNYLALNNKTESPSVPVVTGFTTGNATYKYDVASDSFKRA